jgi:site-specific recombinase XerD
VVWITPRWYGVVKQWMAKRLEAETDHLFLNQHRRPLTVDGIQYRLRVHCQAANIQLTCHQLRHTFARRLAEQGMPTESIAELLGHQPINKLTIFLNRHSLLKRPSRSWIPATLSLVRTSR